MTSPRRLLAPLRRRPARLSALVLALALLWSLPTSTAAFTSTSGRGSTLASDSLDPPTGLSATRDCPPVVAPAFRSASSASSSATSVTVARPAGVQPGDLLLAWVQSQDDRALLSGPSDWVESAEINYYADFQGIRAALYRRVATSSEAASYTFAWNDANVTGLAIVAAYTGVDTTSPFDTGSLISNASSTSNAAPATAPASAPTLYVYGIGAPATSSLTAPSSATVRRTVTGNSDILNLADEVRSASGDTGVRSFTNSTARISQALGAALRAVVPASTVSLSWTATADTYATGYQLGRTGTDSSSSTTAVSGRTTVSHGETLPSRTTGYSYALRAVSGSWISTAVSASIAAC